jgi:Asp-tRNA(Asn)/Glu-tRNA(Gln) amidotransferase A subunit family amidase
MLVAIALIYLLLVVNFQSWLDPFIILTALTGALAGVIWGLHVTSTTLSVPAMMGAIMCLGVATANSVLVVTFARTHLQEGMDSVKAAWEAGTGRLRLGLARYYYWSDLDSEVERIAASAVAKLTDAGAEIVEVEVGPLSLDAFKAQRCRSLQLFEFRPDLTRYLVEHDVASFNDVAAAIGSPTVKATVDRFIIGSDAPTRAMYEQALHEYRPALQTAFATTFSEARLDATIFPMTQVSALPIGEEAEFEVRGNRFPLRFLGRNADPGTCAGLPGIVLPAGQTKGDLPVGIALDAPAGADRRLLGIGLSIEGVLGWLPAPALSSQCARRVY